MIDPQALTLRINGVEHTLQVDARVTLLDALRDQLDLTGTNKACNRRECRACTVLIDGRRVVAAAIVNAEPIDDGRAGMPATAFKAAMVSGYHATGRRIRNLPIAPEALL
jgi:xanthine dehydrogenase iron-sulfur cluster and FAD-binding subunit A